MACTAFAPLYWSKNDTDKTIAQIKEHNAAGKAICTWGAAKKKAEASGVSFRDRWHDGVKIQLTVFR